MNKEGEKTRILFAITKSNWGGAQKYVHDLATALNEEYDICVALGGNGPLKQKLDKAEIDTKSSASLIRKISPLKDIYSLIWCIKTLHHCKPHIFHLNSSKIGALGAVAAALYTPWAYLNGSTIPRVVFTAHGWAFNEDRSLVSTWMIVAAHWITLVCSDAVICVSNNIKQAVVGWPLIPANQLKVVYNGVSAPQFLSKKAAQSKLQLPRDTHDVIIGTIGELRPLKGHSHLISSVANIRDKHDIHLGIIGDGDYKGTLEEQVATHNLENTVSLLGHQDNAARYLHAFDIFVLPSLSEALGYALIEAGFAGLPAIASDVGGIPEVIDDNKSGILVPPGNTEALTNALNRLISDPELQDTLGRNLRKKVHDTFTQEKMVANTTVMYESLLF